jgi:hypothetical protein
MTVYYNIYRNHSYNHFGTVAVEIDSDSKVPPVEQAAKSAGEKLNIDWRSVTAIMSTQQQFWKTGI